VSDPSSRRVSPPYRSLAERTLAAIAEAGAAPLMGFDSLQRVKRRRSTIHGLYLPATFRLQGLITLLTVFSLRNPAGFFSRRRRSWDSPFEAFSARKVIMRSRIIEPTCRLPADQPIAETNGREPECRGFWALTLTSVPCVPTKD